MNKQEYRTVTEFESSLEPGDIVRALWTNSGGMYSGIGEVVRVNGQSIRIALTEPPWEYDVGQHIVCPRLTLRSGGQLWSVNNRIEPAEGYPTDMEPWRTKK